MRPDEYQKNARRTENVPEVSLDHGTTRLLHAALGICTEAGEFADQIKRHMFYGEQIDRTHAIEEVGDILWYISIVLDELRSSFSETFQANIDKLRKRYKKGYSHSEALNRDLAKERLALEEGE